MPLFSFQFPAQRYHATPWGSHVNEGLVEWPPSPWRILRALIHTGFAKEGWTEVPAPMRRILERLSSTLPSYFLPQATTAHSRHYMPAPEKTTKVIDAFAWLGTEPLLIDWPCELEEQDEQLLSSLVGNMSYLGRAESWVQGKMLEDAARADFKANAFPTGEGTEPTMGPGWEQTTLLAPAEAGGYHLWRESALAEAEQALRRQAEQDGKKITKKALVQLAQTYPTDLAACLTVETSWLQAQGWSQPPGSRRVLYWRRNDGLAPMRPRASTRVRQRQESQPNAALIALSTDNPKSQILPRLKDMLPVAERLHRILVWLASRCPDGVDCEELTGKAVDGQPLVGHHHAKIIPLCLNTRRQVDHFLLHCDPNFPLGDAARWALHRLRTLGAAGKGPQDEDTKKLFASLVGLGGTQDMAGAVGAPLGRSAIWRSSTPFVPPRHLKPKRHTLEDQIQAELNSRNLPQAITIERFTKDELVSEGFLDFKIRRSRGKPQPPAEHVFGLELRFAEPINGPLLLGYGSHFGLGMFCPPGQRTKDQT